MKILINTSPLLAPISGVGRYVRGLTRALSELEDVHQYTYFTPPVFAQKLPNISEQQVLSARRSMLLRRWPKPEQVQLAGDWVRRKLFSIGSAWKNFDVYHEPNAVPFGFPARTVVTVLDLSILKHPETHPEVRVKLVNRHFENGIQRATRIIAISQFTAKELMDHFGISQDQIDVIYLAADERFRPLDKTLVERYKREKGLPEEYILFVGTIEPRKNLKVLLQAYAKLHLGVQRKYPLVIAGNKGWQIDRSPYDEIKNLAEDLGLGEKIIFTGYVYDKELPYIYNGASIFVYPSIYEGFGLPPLEAMSCGIPVICSNAASLPEIVEDAGLLISPYDSTAWADAILQLLSDTGMQKDYRQRGLQQAAKFTWERCARQTLNTYQRTVEESS
jgi:glycosyltransferase involved in cell wall biosynthesis